MQGSCLKSRLSKSRLKNMHDQLQAEMQSQINQLKLQLSNSIAQLQGPSSKRPQPTRALRRRGCKRNINRAPRPE
jgi:hypothetical protein